MTAPMMLTGPMTGEWFAAYTRQILAPSLTAGDIVILDNLPAHRGAAVRDAVEALQDAICIAIDDVCTRQATACFTAAGYEPD